jgi:hypothetical protein
VWSEAAKQPKNKTPLLAAVTPVPIPQAFSVLQKRGPSMGLLACTQARPLVFWSVCVSQPV